jgi:hypothetical protein
MVEVTGAGIPDRDDILELPDRDSQEYLETLAEVLNNFGDAGDALPYRGRGTDRMAT